MNSTPLVTTLLILFSFQLSQLIEAFVYEKREKKTCIEIEPEEKGIITHEEENRKKV